MNVAEEQSQRNVVSQQFRMICHKISVEYVSYTRYHAFKKLCTYNKS